MADLIGEQNLSPEAIQKLEIFNTALLKSIKVACNGDRGWASQTILKELRDFVECVMFLIAFQGKESQRKYDYQNICSHIVEFDHSGFYTIDTSLLQ